MAVCAKMIVDKLPGSCTECKLGRRYGLVGDVFCQVLKEYFTGNVTPPYKERPDECPLAEREEMNMNKWQQVYCDIYFDGKTPRTKEGKRRMDLLGKVKAQITVEFPDFTGVNGFKPAHKETYTVTADDCDMPSGKISVTVLASNLSLWLDRGYKVTTH